MLLKMVTPPAVKPVTLQEVMAQSRLDIVSPVLNSGTLTPGQWYLIAMSQPNYFYTGCAAGDTFQAPTFTELSSGTLSIGTWYQITATQSNHFYMGCNVGDVFQAAAATTLDASDRVLQVTVLNASNTVQPIPEGTYLNALILAATEYVQNLCGPLITQTWNQFERHFPSELHWFEYRRSVWNDSDTVFMGGRHRNYGRYDFNLGKPIVQSITQITYVDAVLGLQTLSPSVYTLESEGQWRNRVILQKGQEWPTDQLARGNAVTIQFKCGYGDTEDTIPAPIRMAILMLVSQWYENREPVLTGPGSQMIALPFAVDALLANYRWEGF